MDINIKRENYNSYMKEYVRKRKLADPEYKEKELARIKKWQLDNAEKVKAYKQKNEAKYRDKNRERLAKWREENRESDRASKRAYNRRNPDKVLALTRARQTRKMNAMPTWANKFFIQEIYALSKLREKVTGIKFNVDHIVPLVSKKVCGLHVENNLRIIPKTENQKKGNRFWENMP